MTDVQKTKTRSLIAAGGRRLPLWNVTLLNLFEVMLFEAR